MAQDSQYIWMDGKLVSYKDATVHVLSHSLHYGSAAFEGIRAYATASGKTAIFKAHEHIERFLRSVRALAGRTEYHQEQLINAMIETVRANQFDSCYIRPIAYIADDFRGLKLQEGARMHVAIATWKWGKYLGEASSKGIRTCISSFRRPDVSSSLPWAKLSGNYLNSINARREAAQRGLDEAILLDMQGFVAEGSGENIFVVKNGSLLTPPADAILPGLTRACIFDLAKVMGLTLKEARITRNQLYDADELFFTGTAAEVTPIREVDGYTIGNGSAGSITRQLAELYEKCTRGQIPEFEHWLCYV